MKGKTHNMNNRIEKINIELKNAKEELKKAKKLASNCYLKTDDPTDFIIMRSSVNNWEREVQRLTEELNRITSDVQDDRADGIKCNQKVLIHFENIAEDLVVKVSNYAESSSDCIIATKTSPLGNLILGKHPGFEGTYGVDGVIHSIKIIKVI